VVRGIGVPGPLMTTLFWPETSQCLSANKEALLEFTYAHPYSPYPYLSAPNAVLAAWFDSLPDVRERLEGFTFQGGDAQVVFRTGLNLGSGVREWPLSGCIANCLFDMRHNWTANDQGGSGPYTVTGPWFGVMAIKSFHGDPVAAHPPVVPPCAGTTGYFDQEVVLQNNTFVLGRASSPENWYELSRNDAVAVIDVTDPGCTGTSCTFVDPNKARRGLGSNALINNLFRIPKYQGTSDRRMAMLGIDVEDVRVQCDPGITTAYCDFNGYHPSRVGSTNVTFTSTPVDRVVTGQSPLGPLYNCFGNPCVPNTLPSDPILRVWNGAANPNPMEYDAAFVGEYLHMALNLPDVRDWRLLPDSPAIDLGHYADQLIFENGVVYEDSTCPEITTFDWDGESYGNRRIINGSPDLGFDEFHMLVMTGTYANDSFCHNKNDMGATPVSGHLHPSVGDSTRDVRIVLADDSFATFTIEIYKTFSTPTIQPPGLMAWTKPPRTLATPLDDPAVADPDFRTKYIAFTQLMRSGALVARPPQQPAGPTTQNPIICATLFDAGYNGIFDSECSGATCSNSYFNTQPRVLLGPNPGDRRYGNLQFEYR
jgi:hypothetical protein